jgi:type IV pilus assembly protein PilM
MASSFFTIDIGEKYIKVTDSVKKGDLLSIEALAYDLSPANIYNSESEQQNELVSKHIQKLVTDAGIKKKNVNIIIPDSHSYSQILEMPAITEKELLSAIKYQADQFIPIPIDKVNLDIEILSEDKKNKKLLILLVAAPNVVLDKVAGIVESAGFNPVLIENEISASVRGVSFVNQKKVPEGELYINFGSDSTTLYFLSPVTIDKKTELIPYQIRNFPLGLTIFSKEIKVNYNLEDKDISNLIATVGLTDAQSAYDLKKILTSAATEFCDEVNKFVLSVKSKMDIPIKKVYVFGEGYKMLGLNEKISASLNLPVSPLSLSESLVHNNVYEFFKNDIPLFIPSLGGNLAET